MKRKQHQNRTSYDLNNYPFVAKGFIMLFFYLSGVLVLLSEPIINFISSMQVWVIAVRARDKNSRGLKFSGVLCSDFRTAAVNARRRSLSTFILQMFILVARRS